VLAAHLGRLCPGFLLPQDPDDLFFREPAWLHVQRQEAQEAYLREQERLRTQARLDAFIEGKAGELARLQKISSFRDYVAKQHADAESRERDPVFGAANDLVDRLQRALSTKAIGEALPAEETGQYRN
jgi:hypothetical protein